MNTLLLVYSGFLTLFIVGGIHYYEEKISKLDQIIRDFNRANSYQAKHAHDLAMANDILISQNKLLKKHNEELINGQSIQYESSKHPNINEVNITNKYIETDKLIEL